ncbi:Hypothetical protein R9X50_00275500 [Acrodontium crateriforme]|uniref:Capsule polysaccharide biosynthesis protein n=1 Tax=Acrodontium crateriforme TaxID=150365 RepID=A0AAQ3M4G7_9PEZI|nr:Hypothetical protein R9X50_00275500 [Acrodontium crateriforme]
MASNQYADFVPPKLRPIDPSRLVTDTDEDIASAVRTFQPVTSQRNLWAFWHSGFDGLPPWCKRNVIAWVRKLGPSWTVRVVGRSENLPNDVYQYAGPENFPECFRENKFQGKGAKQRTSDMIRLVLLYLHGGVYMDVSCILCRSLDDICFRQIEDPSTPWEIAMMEMQSRDQPGQIINSFIACSRRNPFIKHWHDIFCNLWTDSTIQKGIHAHPLLRHLPLVQFPTEENWTAPFSAEDWTDYSSHMLCFERLSLLSEPNGFDGADYFHNHILLMSANREIFHMQEIGEDHLFDLLVLPFEPHSSDAQQQEARKRIPAMLAESSFIKFGEGYWMEGLPVPIATRFREDEYSDCRPNTWVGWLRWASDRFEQDLPDGWTTPREEILLPAEKIVRVGVLEPVH